MAEAAERLDITKEAVRKRVSRGTLRSDKDPDGTVRVYVPPSDTSSRTSSGAFDRDELVEALRDQIEDLRRERDEWREQARVADRLLSAALERIPPQLEASPEPREAPQTVEKEPERAEPHPATGEAQESVQRPWWRRMFGG